MLFLIPNPLVRYSISHFLQLRVHSLHIHFYPNDFHTGRKEDIFIRTHERTQLC